MSVRHFKTHSQLKSIIGKELINNDDIAVLELVKNSFDAGSKKVDVSFKNILTNDDQTNSGYGENSSKIIVKDWGVGMSLKDLEDRWLNIAYSDKKIKKEQHGRYQAGNKGIGRFSCDRLGRYLDIYTRAAGEKVYHLSIDWQDFEEEADPNKRIETVDVQVSELKGPELARFASLKHGTVIEISKLRSSWDDDKLGSLRRYLERLISPNQRFGGGKFSLHLEAEEFRRSVNGPIANQIFDRLSFTSTCIEAEISEDGTQVSTTLTDKGREVLQLVEENTEFKLLRGVKVVIYYLNPYGKGYFRRQTGLDKVQFGSIFLFINGFRVAPYGEQKDDWLGIDRHKVQAHSRSLGTREVIGRIEIHDPEQNYKIISSREGIVRDERANELMNRPDGFYFRVHRRLERYVVDGLDWDRIPEDHLKRLQIAGENEWHYKPKDEIYSLPEKEKNLKILEALNGVLSTSPERILSFKIDPNLISDLAKAEKDRAEKILENFEDLTPEFGKSTKHAMDQVRKAFGRQNRTIARGRKEQVALRTELENTRTEARLVAKENLFLRAAATGESREIAGLQHQIGFSAGRVTEKIKELRRSIEAGKPIEALNKLIEIISFENQKILSIATYATKAQFNLVQEQLPNEDLVQFIKQYVENVWSMIPEAEGLAKMEVTVEADGIGPFRKKFAPIEIVMLIDNLLDNAAKARASATHVSFKNGESGNLVITVRDNGNGVDSRYTDRIFDFGFTTTNGSGIGLSHVKKVLRGLGGSISFKQPPGKGSEFVVSIPK